MTWVYVLAGIVALLTVVGVLGGAQLDELRRQVRSDLAQPSSNSSPKEVTMAIPTDAQLKAGAANQAAQKRITQIEHERDYWYARYQEMISQNYAITTGRPMSRPDVSPPASSWVDRSQQAMEQRLTVLIEHIRTVLINERLQNFTTQEALEKITDLINGRGNHLATKP